VFDLAGVFTGHRGSWSVVSPGAPPFPARGDITRSPATWIAQGAYFCKHLARRVRLLLHAQAGQSGTPGKEEARMGSKAWMLVWAGVLVSSVLCVYAAVWN
jgi:hypothetical protein